jgi:hypothetical protein
MGSRDASALSEYGVRTPRDTRISKRPLLKNHDEGSTFFLCPQDELKSHLAELSALVRGVQIPWEEEP